MTSDRERFVELELDRQLAARSGHAKQIQARLNHFASGLRLFVHNHSLIRSRVEIRLDLRTVLSHSRSQLFLQLLQTSIPASRPSITLPVMWQRTGSRS
jgi:hypothetical protein